MGRLTPAEQQKVLSGELRLRAIESTRPAPLSRFEEYVFRCWERLSHGRRSAPMGGPGNIPWRDVQELLDREGVIDAPKREQVERVIYTMDAAVKTELAKVADRKVQAASRGRQSRR